MKEEQLHKIYERESLNYLVKGTTQPALFVGLASEVGEVMQEYMKTIRSHNTLKNRDEEILDELADVLWYITAIANTKGSSLASLMRRNLVKLEARQLDKIPDLKEE